MPLTPSTAPETQALFLCLNAALPQTQCTRCGYPDCASYAKAMAEGEAEINQCPPGGQAGIERLAALTGRPALPLNPEHGTEVPALRQRDDDKEDVIENRLKVYNAQTAPLIEHYQGRGLLRVVNADQPMDRVYAEFVKAIG